jgi:glyoxylate carboligase
MRLVGITAFEGVDGEGHYTAFTAPGAAMPVVGAALDDAEGWRHIDDDEVSIAHLPAHGQRLAMYIRDVHE